MGLFDLIKKTKEEAEKMNEETMLPALKQNVPAGDTLSAGVYCTYLERLPDGNPKVMQGFFGLTANGTLVCMKRPDDNSFDFVTALYDMATFVELTVSEPMITCTLDIKYETGVPDEIKDLSISINLNVPAKRFPNQKANAEKIIGVMREKAKELEEKAKAAQQ